MAPITWVSPEHGGMNVARYRAQGYATLGNTYIQLDMKLSGDLYFTEISNPAYIAPNQARLVWKTNDGQEGSLLLTTDADWTTLLNNEEFKYEKEYGLGDFNRLNYIVWQRYDTSKIRSVSEYSELYLVVSFRVVESSAQNYDYESPSAGFRPDEGQFIVDLME